MLGSSTQITLPPALPYSGTEKSDLTWPGEPFAPQACRGRSRASLCFTAEVSQLRTCASIYITSGLPFVVFTSASVTANFTLSCHLDTLGALHNRACIAAKPALEILSSCLSLSTCSGLHQRSIHTIRKPSRSPCSTPSTNMGGSSFSPTWVFSLRFGHGESQLQKWIARPAVCLHCSGTLFRLWYGCPLLTPQRLFSTDTFTAE